MRRILRHVIKHFFFAGFFSLVITILYLAFPVYLLVLFEKVLDSYSFSSLITVTVGTVFALGILGLLHFVRSRILIRSGLALNTMLSPDVLREMFSAGASLNRPASRQGGADLFLLSNTLGDGTLSTLFDAAFIPVLMVFVFLLHPTLGLVVLGGCVVCGLLAVLQHRLIRKRWDQAKALHDFGDQLLRASLGNLVSVTAMGMDQGIAEQWQTGHRQSVRLQSTVNGHLTGLNALNVFVLLSLQVFVFGLGLSFVFDGAMTAGVAVAASVLTGRCLLPLRQVMAAWKKVVDARAAYQRLDVLLKGAQERETMELPVPKGKLEVEGVSLALSGRALLRNVSFSLEPGEFLGLIGPSGAGKSVLTRIILGIWPSQGGKVRLDGADVFQWDHQELGPAIGYLSQEVELFSGSVSKNIARMGEVDAEAVIAAARLVGLHETILRLPQGYDTDIGEGGRVLPAGQRRLLGLARSVYQEPRLVVLDEPNADLDDAGEKALLDCVQQLKEQGTTTIMITHKPGLLNAADKLLMLKNGQREMFGPRQEILQQLSGQKRQATATGTTHSH